MDKEVKIPPDWNAEVQTNIDRYDFTFNVQKDFTIAGRIYGRMLELKGIYLEACDQDPTAAGTKYHLHTELDQLILRAKERLETWNDQ